MSIPTNRYLISKIMDLLRNPLAQRNFKSFSESDWESFFEKYAFEDIRPFVGSKLVSKRIIKALEGIIIDHKKEDDEFSVVDSLLHDAATMKKPKKTSRGENIEHETPEHSDASDKLEKIACIQAYVHILIDNHRFYHAENVLKFEIRSANSDLRKLYDFSELYFLLGFVLLQQHKSDESIEALDSYRIIIENNPDLKLNITKCLRYLGSAWYSQGNQHGIFNAEKFYKDTIAFNINDTHSLIAANNLANFYINEYERGQTHRIQDVNDYLKQSQEIFNALVKMNSTEKGGFRSLEERYLYDAILKDTIAVSKLSEKRYDEAITDLNNALILIRLTRASPAPILYHLGMAYYHKKETPRAISNLVEATSIGKKSISKSPYLKLGYVSKAFDALGIIYYESKDLSNAKSHFQEALEFDANNHLARNHLISLDKPPKQPPADWFQYWTKTNGKKIALGIICSGIVLSLIIPGAVSGFMMEQTIEINSISNTFHNSEKETTLIKNNFTKSAVIDESFSKKSTCSLAISCIDESGAKGEKEVTTVISSEIPSNSTTTITKQSYKYVFSETQLAFSAILIFILLLPNIKTFKAAGVEIETRPLEVQEQGQPIITHPRF